MAICPVCKGSGLANIPHVPSNSGGWMDEKYPWSGGVCGACNGSGYVAGDEHDSTCESEDVLEDDDDVRVAAQESVERLVRLVEKSIRLDRIEDVKERLQDVFQFGRCRGSFPDGRAELPDFLRRMDQKKLDLLDSIQLSDELSIQHRAVLAILVSRLDPTSTADYQKVKDYFDRIKPASGGTLLELGLDLLHDDIWEWEKQNSLGMW